MISEQIRKRFRAGRLGPALGRAARALCVDLSTAALSIFLLASTAQATVTTTMASFTEGAGSADAWAAITTGTNSLTAGISGSEAYLPAAAAQVSRIETTFAIDALNDFAPRSTIDYAEIFHGASGPITEQDAALDLAQLILVPAGGNPALTDGNSYMRSAAALDLVANGLGPTSIVKRGAGRFGSAFGFNLLPVFLVLRGSVVAGLALAHWKLT